MILYKYIKPERIDILTKGMIRFTQPAALNDPFEMQPFFYDLVPDNRLVSEFYDGITVKQALTDKKKFKLSIETFAI